MPQKINPDVLELIRGKSARVVGNLQTLMVLIKGLPLAYNRDLQEDKLPLFDSYDTVVASVLLATPIVHGAKLLENEIRKGLELGYLDATTLMEFMIEQGVPQRTAHHLVGQLVGEAMQLGVPLGELDAQVFSDAHPVLDERVFDVLGVENAIAAFRSYGSTAPDQVRQQVETWKEMLSS